ncbi:DNA cytosine methyltransferase [Halomonas sp. AOP27-A1-41]|uniref:DNA cytosine methyltransferase n=1 Tax=Halomonas sp. AOP27-A1-41 TaxID=3457707 RepID=UPI004033C997
MTAYYNEIDPAAAQWLRNLIAAGQIAPGDVDERSIEDVTPDDLANYTQCHFFAGVGVWSYALRRAGWPDELPVWTGSCPCQPFSAAGKRSGFDDERHLWPHFAWLIGERRPPVIFGEQVASKAVEPWIDLVHADVETLGYAFGCVPFPSAGVGAPHIRDRAFWVADTNDQGLEGWPGVQQRTNKLTTGANSLAERVGNATISSQRPHDRKPQPNVQCSIADRGRDISGGMADNNRGRRKQRNSTSATARHRDTTRAASSNDMQGQPCPTNGFWRDADWLFCRDGKWRPVEPGTQPLVDGAAARVVRLRAYGNAINAEAAQAFIEAYTEARFVA